MVVKPALKKKYNVILPSPIGALGIEHDDDALRGIVFLGNITKTSLPTSSFELDIIQQLDAYFSDPMFQFNLPYHLSTTPFQLRVLTALEGIPCGETRTYGTLAKALKTSARAIGNACRRNPLPLIFPCHRVVGQSSPGGFSGQKKGPLIDIKQALLEKEQRACTRSSHRTDH